MQPARLRGVRTAAVVSGKEDEEDMAKTTRKTESVPAAAEKKPAPARKKAVGPAAGAEKVTPRRVKKPAPDASAAPEAVAAAIEPTHDEIALRAWSIYERRGRSHGQAMSDWLQAKAELCRERGLKS
jgi:hypothetical protein